MPASVCIWTDAYETGRGVAVTGMNARTPQEAQANAAFIVRACNSHDILVRVLERYEAIEGELCSVHMPHLSARLNALAHDVKEARAALASANR